MVRIDVDIDHDACEELMRICGFLTQSDAINFALRTQAKQRRAMEEARARARERMSPEEFRAMRAIGWGEDLDEMHGGRGYGPSTS